MRDKIFAMPIRSVLGAKVRYVNDMTGKKRSGKVLSIFINGLKVKNYEDVVEMVDYENVLEVSDAENKG